MKTINDLFSINTKGMSYDDISVYIASINRRWSIRGVWSDSGVDISFKEDDSYMREDEYFRTVSMADIAQVFCQNEDIIRDTVLKIYGGDDECVMVDKIEFDFNKGIIYLIIE